MTNTGKKCPRCGKTIFDIEELPSDITYRYRQAVERLEITKSCTDLTKLPLEHVDKEQIEIYIKIALDNYVVSKLFLKNIENEILTGKPPNSYLRVEYGNLYLSICSDEEEINDSN